ncbi:hypothetical protein N7532_000261 [Penicillium argentinense]|uniref:DUF7730 domain-containing protein n=1 Tax=Penicillium argentinense TaxID=1131581 RepID=A0A9W9KNP4_9EURO|nr:uncharacterized protein N7532_000261 [Penicillium argentinense]KAJ5112216.1 hypothetical protein N7532_000261 [Penicillium argentinense]
MRHFDAWVVRDPYSIWHYYSTGRRWQDTVRDLIHERAICSPLQLPDAKSATALPKGTRNAPPPTPPDTKKAAVGEIDLTTIHSQQSLLLSLPPEIRQIIWSYVFGASTLHLVQFKNKIRHIRCDSDNPSLTHHRHCCPLTPARWRIYDGRLPGHSDSLLYPHTHEHLPDNISDASTALLRTCKAVYAEAADTLYHASTFDVDDLYTFIAFAQSLSPHALRSLRKLTVQWSPVWTPLAGQDHKGSIYAHTHSDALWTRFWATVASLPSLEELKLSIDLGRFTGTITGGGAVVVSGQRLPLLLSEPWVLPLLNVRGLREFEMAVTARCDLVAKGVVEPELVRNAGVLRDQLRAVMTTHERTPLGEIEGLGVEGVRSLLSGLRELLGERRVKRGVRLAITAE